MGDVDVARLPDLVVDGGDRSCGELLLKLALPVRGQPAGAIVRLIATDPVAAIDLPYWCHLTGNGYLGEGCGPDGRPYYDIGVRRVGTGQPSTSPPVRARPDQAQPTDDVPGSAGRVANPARGPSLP